MPNEIMHIKKEGSCVNYDASDDVPHTESTWKSKPAPEIDVLRPSTWCQPDVPRPTTKYECECGNEKFTAHYKAGGYETSIVCLGCGNAYIVHEG